MEKYIQQAVDLAQWLFCIGIAHLVLGLVLTATTKPQTRQRQAMAVFAAVGVLDVLTAGALMVVAVATDLLVAALGGG